MILLAFLLLPLAAGLISLPLAKSSEKLARWCCLVAMLGELGVSVWLWITRGEGRWIAAVNWPWIRPWGVHFHLGMDGLSLLFILLTAVLGVLCVLMSWSKSHARPGFFYLNLMGVIMGLNGVFLSLDLFLFYLFWELMLVPTYFLIAVWGSERRTYASLKFFIFTQASGLLMLLSILGLYYVHGRATGVYTFDYLQLIGTKMSSSTSFWLMLGFCIAFAVKLPVVPLHTWSPDAYSEAPTVGSVLLAALLVKTAGYGLLRFVLPLFPGSATEIATVAMALGTAGILYGAVMAFGQSDLKRLIAYTSLSHMGFVVLGIFAGNTIALQGAVIQMICHGLSTGALFMIVGSIQDRIHSRDLSSMGGFWEVAPRMSASGMFFALASLGLPGLGNFVGEYLVLLGTYRVSPLLAILSAIGLIVATVYSLWIVQAAFHGKMVQPEKRSEVSRFRDFSGREAAIMVSLMLILVWLGVYPQRIIRTARGTLTEVAREYR